MRARCPAGVPDRGATLAVSVAATVDHRPRAGPPGTIRPGRIVQLPTQPAVGPGRTIKSHPGVGSETAVLDRQRTRQTRHLPLPAAHRSPAAAKPEPASNAATPPEAGGSPNNECARPSTSPTC